MLKEAEKGRAASSNVSGKESRLPAMNTMHYPRSSARAYMNKWGKTHNPKRTQNCKDITHLWQCYPKKIFGL